MTEGVRSERQEAEAGHRGRGARRRLSNSLLPTENLPTSRASRGCGRPSAQPLRRGRLQQQQQGLDSPQNRAGSILGAGRQPSGLTTGMCSLLRGLPSSRYEPV